jgi:hypothetical protein
MVTRKHTRCGRVRFVEAIHDAAGRLDVFRETEQVRIAYMQHQHLTSRQADSLILRSYEQGLISHHTLPNVIKEWRKPSYEEFSDQTLWSLLNCYTTVLGDQARRQPQKYAHLTMKLQQFLTGDAEPQMQQAS